MQVEYEHLEAVFQYCQEHVFVDLYLVELKLGVFLCKSQLSLESLSDVEGA